MTWLSQTLLLEKMSWDDDVAMRALLAEQDAFLSGTQSGAARAVRVGAYAKSKVSASASKSISASTKTVASASASTSTPATTSTSPKRSFGRHVVSLGMDFGFQSQGNEQSDIQPRSEAGVGERTSAISAAVPFPPLRQGGQQSGFVEQESATSTDSVGEKSSARVTTVEVSTTSPSARSSPAVTPLWFEAAPPSGSADTAQPNPIEGWRFDFSGRPLTVQEQHSVPSTTGLHHHGLQPELAGYTLEELDMLARSSVPGQRIMSLDSLRRIISKCWKGEYEVLPRRGLEVLDLLLNRHGVAVLAHMALRDAWANATVRDAAVHLLHALCVPPESSPVPLLRMAADFAPRVASEQKSLEQMWTLLADNRNPGYQQLARCAAEILAAALPSAVLDVERAAPLQTSSVNSALVKNIENALAAVDLALQPRGIDHFALQSTVRRVLSSNARADRLCTWFLQPSSQP